MLASMQDARCSSLKVCGGSKVIEPLAGEEDFCGALVGDLFPTAHARILPRRRPASAHGEAAGVRKLSQKLATLLLA
jgi:hypothetical protein